MQTWKVSNRFPTGTQVATIMGCRMEGTVVKPFLHREANDGTYREPPPNAKVVFVRWSDGSKGWINETQVAKRSG
jgi:hypothetical protein